MLRLIAEKLRQEALIQWPPDPKKDRSHKRKARECHQAASAIGALVRLIEGK